MQTGQRQRPGRAAPEGDLATLQIAGEHPLCIEHTLDRPGRHNTIRAYRNYSSAAAAFARLRNRRHDRLRPAGRAIVSASRTGRPVDVYFNGDWTPKEDNLRHTLLETSAALSVLSAFPSWQALRGPHTGERRFDVLFRTPDGTEIGAEIDCGTMPEQKVRARWERLRGWPGIVLLIVAPRYDTPVQRICDLIRWGEDINDFAYYAPLEELVRDPAGMIWVDCEATGFTLEELMEEPWKNSR